MDKMRGITIAMVSVLLVMISCGLSDPTLYLTGQKEGVDAIVIIDGVEVGTMEDVKEGAYFEISLARGKHKILVKSINGKVFESDIDIDKPLYVNVVFDMPR